MTRFLFMIINSAGLGQNRAFCYHLRSEGTERHILPGSPAQVFVSLHRMLLLLFMLLLLLSYDFTSTQTGPAQFLVWCYRCLGSGGLVTVVLVVVVVVVLIKIVVVFNFWLGLKGSTIWVAALYFQRNNS